MQLGVPECFIIKFARIYIAPSYRRLHKSHN